MELRFPFRVESPDEASSNEKGNNQHEDINHSCHCFGFDGSCGRADAAGTARHNASNTSAIHTVDTTGYSDARPGTTGTTRAVGNFGSTADEHSSQCGHDDPLVQAAHLRPG